jgi:hypothetical protein
MNVIYMDISGTSLAPNHGGNAKKKLKGPKYLLVELASGSSLVDRLRVAWVKILLI